MTRKICFFLSFSSFLFTLCIEVSFIGPYSDINSLTPAGCLGLQFRHYLELLKSPQVRGEDLHKTTSTSDASCKSWESPILLSNCYKFKGSCDLRIDNSL